MKPYQFDYTPKTSAFPHQVDAVEFLRNRDVAALFDEQGLGKTKVVIDALCLDMRDGLIEGAIIICNKSLIPVWEDEIKKHSHLSFVALRGTPKEKGARFMGFSHFYLINYEQVIKELERLKMFLDIRKLAMVLDESQRIKNPTTKTAQSLHALRTLPVKKVIVTGTPVANKPEDIWAQIYFLDGGKLLGNSYESFKRGYGVDVPKTQDLEVHATKLDELKGRLSTISIRRLKDQVLELPGKRYEEVYVSLEGRQWEMYQKAKEDLYLELMELDGQTIIDDMENILKKLLRLNQIASNPGLIDAEYSEEPSKFPVLDQLVEDCIKRGEKVIIWSAFNGNIRALRRRYEHHGSLMLFGEIPIDKRKKTVDLFQNDKAKQVLIANPAAAKEGLTLTAANNAIYLDRNFSLVDYLQSQDRIHRITQTKPCQITKLIAANTIDEYIDEIIYKKHQLAQYIQDDILEFDQDRAYMTKEELQEILG